MPPLFTAFVQSLSLGREPEQIDAVWDRLRALLRHELKRRGLWQLPPSYLGISGWSRWTADDDSTDDALEELTADGYAFIFVDRLRSLQNQLAVKPNIEGLVLLNLRHFLLERQKQHDPLGFRVFEMVQSAVRDAVAEGDLHVLAGDPRIRNDTLLGFLGAGEAPVAPLPELSTVVVRWNDDLLPDLITALGRRQQTVLADLRRHLRQLPRSGVVSFQFRDLIEPLKKDVRSRWAQLWPESLPQPGAHRPPAELDAQRSVEQITRGISEAIERLEVDARTRQYLGVLWQYLRVRAGFAEPVSPRLAIPSPEEAADSELSHRKLAQLLQIPRERLPELFRLLQQLASRSQPADRVRSGGFS